MPVTQIISGAPRNATAGWRSARSIRRAVVVLGVIGMMAGAAALSAEAAVAGVGSQPGNLMFHPGVGAVDLTPTWSTTDGCPTGYRGSAQMAIFNSHGKFLSLISNVAYGVTKSFGGTLDGSIAAILRFADVAKGESLEFTVGCDSLVGGTGKTEWLQSTLVTLSSDGRSFTTSSSNGQQGSASGLQGSTSGGQQGSTAANLGGVATAADRNSSPAAAAWLGGGCALVIAISALIWFRRRRDRSRLM